MGTIDKFCLPHWHCNANFALAGLKILTSNLAKLFRPHGVWANVSLKSKMAFKNEPVQEEFFNGIKGALNCQKSGFERRISNFRKLKDLDETFNELEKVTEAVVKGKYGPLRYRNEHEISHVYPMLERTMIRAKNGINRCLTLRMSKIHPWMSCFDVLMPQEVFNVLTLILPTYFTYESYQLQFDPITKYARIQT